MKKTGKSGCGHLKKVERKRHELAVTKAILQTKEDLRHVRNTPQRKAA